MTKTEMVKRYLLFVVAIFFIGLGIAVTKHAELGISPVSSLPNVVSLRFPFLPFGTWLILSNLTFVVGQILVLRRSFKPSQFLQIPLTFLFGYFTDLGLWLVSGVENHLYWQKCLLVVSGNFILAVGIVLSVIASVLLNPPEGFVKAYSDTFQKSFSNVKIVFDLILVALSVLLSFLFFDGDLVGIREGTVVSAVLVGCFVKLISPPLESVFKTKFNLEKWGSN